MLTDVRFVSQHRHRPGCVAAVVGVNTVAAGYVDARDQRVVDPMPISSRCSAARSGNTMATIGNYHRVHERHANAFAA